MLGKAERGKWKARSGMLRGEWIFDHGKAEDGKREADSCGFTSCSLHLPIAGNCEIELTQRVRNDIYHLFRQLYRDKCYFCEINHIFGTYYEKER